MFDQIKQAYSRISEYANVTPVLNSSTLNKRLGAEIFFKCENFQKVGAFKFRGALNSLLQLSEEQKQQGVIAYSSGNHAQAIACVGKILGIETTIVMPNNAPQIKLDATRGYGAEVILYDPETETREVVANQILSGKTLTLIPPFDYEPVIAGQGTAAYEMLTTQQPELDMMLAPCGGGGLLSGTALATKHILPHCQVYGIEPEQADDATESFRTGKIVIKPNPDTIADGTRTASVGELTFPLIQQNVDDMITVSEQAIIDAVKFYFYRMKLVVEPSGALGLAALMSGKIKPSGKVGVIISGGNVDGPTMSQILTAK